jgi:hypothetical protein
MSDTTHRPPTGSGPGTDRPETNGPGTDQSGTNQPGTNQPGTSGRPNAHQPEDARVDKAAVIAAILLASVLVIYFAVGALGHLYVRFPISKPAGNTDLILRHAPPPSPASTDTLSLMRERLTRQQRAVLEEIGWVDRQNGIARIPLETAMEIAAGGGLPAFAPSAPDPGTNEGRGR